MSRARPIARPRAWLAAGNHPSPFGDQGTGSGPGAVACQLARSVERAQHHPRRRLYEGRDHGSRALQLEDVT
jgi:hypothetical protein